MDSLKKAMIVCESLAPEAKQIAPPDLNIREIELGLHDYPERLKVALQDTLRELESEERWDYVLIGYGLCSGGTVGLKSKRARLVLPKTDDCIAIFLGGRSYYREQFQKEPGTYYFTKGWLRDGAGPLAMYKCEHKWTKKYSKEKAEWIAREVMKNYKRIAFIKTGAYDTKPFEAKAKETAEVFGLKYELLQGSLRYIKDLITGHWDERFIIVEPGQEITREIF